MFLSSLLSVRLFGFDRFSVPNRIGDFSKLGFSSGFALIFFSITFSLVFSVSLFGFDRFTVSIRN